MAQTQTDRQAAAKTPDACALVGVDLDLETRSPQTAGSSV